MQVTPTPFPDLLILKPQRFHDARGFFSESYNKKQLAELGITTEFVQDNLSFSKALHTLRGLHYQREPFTQAKLVSVLQGSVLDVVIDLRQSSPLFGQHFSTKLSSAEGNQLFIPEGFAHGFVTLEPNTVFYYKTSNYFSPDHDSGIRFDDSQLAIDWKVPHELIITSAKDCQLPAFDPSRNYFR